MKVCETGKIVVEVSLPSTDNKHSLKPKRGLAFTNVSPLCFYFFLLVATLSCVPLVASQQSWSGKSAKASPFLRHARGDTECSSDGRQHTNGCLDGEFPKCLVLHGKLRFKLEIRNEK